MEIDLAAVERELLRIPEVRAARIVADATGKPVEVHVLATPAKHAKQVVRDVQSVAVATLGLEIDHRIVSVVQLDDPAVHAAADNAAARATGGEPVDGADGAGGAAPSDGAGGPANGSAGSDASGSANGSAGTGADGGGGRVLTAEPAAGAPLSTVEEPELRIVVDNVATERSGIICAVAVHLRQGERVTIGHAEGPMAASTVPRLVARATLAALRELQPSAERAEIETAVLTSVGDRAVAVTTVVLVVPPNEEVVTGSAPVRSAGEHEAVARAVLDATNRRLGQLG